MPINNNSVADKTPSSPTKSKKTNADKKSNDSTSKGLKRRDRGGVKNLRRAHSIENVVVETSFDFIDPRNSKVAGEGCYVSATVQSKRYYGVLVDQSSMQVASHLHFEEEAADFELNRKMKRLKEECTRTTTASTTKSQLTPESTDDATSSTKLDPSETVENTDTSDQVVGIEATARKQANTDDTSVLLSIQERSAHKTENELESDDVNIYQETSEVKVAAGVVNDKDIKKELQVEDVIFKHGSIEQRKEINKTDRAILKYRWIESKQEETKARKSLNEIVFSDYGILLATFASAETAADGNEEKAEAILTACKNGGGFVDEFYYQYKMERLILDARGSSKETVDLSSIRTSIGFESFLQDTILPRWFPLANLTAGGQKVLNILNLKKEHAGNSVRDSILRSNESLLSNRDIVPMEPRSQFRVCVVGAGIAGLYCCLELLSQCDKAKVDVEVVLLEGQNRLGGRLWTDRTTFTTSDDEAFPVELGASWIHGIVDNPLASLASAANIDFVTTSEDVVMLQSGMKVVDSEKDDYAGKLFDKLLDFAANRSWEDGDDEKTKMKQTAVRWYASFLQEARRVKYPKLNRPTHLSPPSHRHSADVSVDTAVGNVISRQLLSDFANLSKEERRMILWNIKNIEYALGAKITDLSMKFWDIDERHAFEGDHVLLRQGYSSIVEHVYQQLEKYGDKFKCVLDFPVSKVEYARKTKTTTYDGGIDNSSQFINLSDTCCISSQDGSSKHYSDFVVMAVPLGVLKESIKEQTGETAAISFSPMLPFSKRDAINAVGFGLLNKVYLQFPTPFWRELIKFEKNEKIFGNASGLNPHHYMFLDVGGIMDKQGTTSSPAILMSLISGSDAASCEQLSDEDLVTQVLQTLRLLFNADSVPDPMSFKITRWGSDPFARGSYTYLPPGTSDEDFHTLQSAINGNGDSLLQEGSETMRLFFAGEHTTSLHPSMAHGALLSGLRAAKEVVSEMNIKNVQDEKHDRVIPLFIFRALNPKIPPRCFMCHRAGSRVREGNLFAFKRGSRQVLVHNNCAEFSPEVEVNEGHWNHVLLAVNRSKSFPCTLCRRLGASIGCSKDGCDRCYHFSCGEDTGWRFERDGKEFRCDLHRTPDDNSCNRVSMEFYMSRVGHNQVPSCVLCHDSFKNGVCGKMLAFKKQVDLMVVHENCARYTTPNFGSIGEVKTSHIDNDFEQISSVIDRSKTSTCRICGKNGATVLCDSRRCTYVTHYHCAIKSGWKFTKPSGSFECIHHRGQNKSEEEGSKTFLGSDGTTFQHALFSQSLDFKSADVPPNLDFDGTMAQSSFEVVSSDDDLSDDDTSVTRVEEDIVEVDAEDDENEEVTTNLSLIGKLTYLKVRKPNIQSKLVRIHRRSLDDSWEIELFASPIGHQRSSSVNGLNGKISSSNNNSDPMFVVTVASASEKESDQFDPLLEGDIIKTMNGIYIGSPDLDTIVKVVQTLSKETDVLLEIQRYRIPQSSRIVKLRG